MESKDDIDYAKAYQSSKLILDYMYKDYTREIERRKSVETRIPILVTIATFFGGLLLVNNTFDFTKILNNGKGIIYILIMLQGISCICLLASIIIFLSLLMSKPYKSVNTDGFLEMGPQGECEGLVAYDLIEAYKECTDYNKKLMIKNII